MRLAFNDIKKTVSRRSGEPRLIPYLLPLPGASSRTSTKRPSSVGTSTRRSPSHRSAARELDALIALYDSYVGRTRATWPEDRAAILIGDYRLARCLESVLSEWYEWQSPAWPQTGAEAAALAAHAIATPSQLRLALYDFVSASHSGFLPAHERDIALDAFAATLGIARLALGNLLYLDSDAHTVLVRLTSEPPSAEQLAMHYNQRVLEAVLASSSHVEWLLTPEFAAATGEPLGTLVKRICFLARRMGVQYDVTFADGDTYANDQPLPRVAEHRSPYLATTKLDIPAKTATASVSPFGSDVGAQPDAPTFTSRDSHISAESATVSASPRPVGGARGGASDHREAERARSEAVELGVRSLAVTLYGPQEMTGAPNQYGERLARLCRALLGYRRSAGKSGRSALAGAGLTGSARVYLHGRPLIFDFDARLLALIGSSDEGNGQGSQDSQDGADQPDDPDPQFDSSLEQRLHVQFAALERDGEAHGWRMEREPEPILAGATILVPDFALTRGTQRVYLEIAGYWRPEYRERKARKLAVVRGHVALVLAAPQSARAEFAALEPDFPILWYKDTVSAEALLALLDRAYNDLDARLARLDPAAIIAEVSMRGFIPPVESMALLRCYSRGELARALDLLQRHADEAEAPAPEWLDGIGLCSSTWLAHLLGDIRHAVEQAENQRLPLAELSALVPMLLDSHGAASTTETLVEMLARRAGLHIVRASIFDAEVRVDDAPALDAPLASTPPKSSVPQPRRRLRRTHTRTNSYTTQSIFPPEQPGPDDPVPDIPTRAP